MIRRQLKTFDTYQEAAEFKSTLEGNIQIRRRNKPKIHFDVMKRIEGKKTDLKVENQYTKRKKKGRRYGSFESGINGKG